MDGEIEKIDREVLKNSMVKKKAYQEKKLVLEHCLLK